MNEPKTPNGDIPSLYSLATSGDQKAKNELLALYEDYIKTTVSNLKAKHKLRLDSEDLIQDGRTGLLKSFMTLELSQECPAYSAWIEWNIDREILSAILREMRTPESDRAPHDL